MGLVQEPKTLKKILENGYLTEIVVELLRVNAFPEFFVDIVGELSREKGEKEVGYLIETNESKGIKFEQNQSACTKNYAEILSVPINECNFANKQKLDNKVCSPFQEENYEGSRFSLDFTAFNRRWMEGKANYILAFEIIENNLPIKVELLQEREKSMENFLDIYSTFYKEQANAILTKTINGRLRDYYYTIKKYTFENNFRRVLFSLLNHNIDPLTFIRAVARNREVDIVINLIGKEIANCNMYKNFLTSMGADNFGAYDYFTRYFADRYENNKKFYSDITERLKAELLKTFENQEIVEAILRDQELCLIMKQLLDKGISPEIVMTKVAKTDLNKFESEKSLQVKNSNFKNQKPVFCKFCLKNNHCIEDCWNLKKKAARLDNERFKICYYCKEPGHLLRFCGKLKSQTHKNEEKMKHDHLENFLKY